MKNAWKHVIWWKRKCIKVLPNIDEENLGSFDHEKDQKRKKKWMRNRERNWRDRQKETFEKFRFDSYMFQNFKIWSDERNRVGIENNIEKGSISPEESGRNRGNPKLLKGNLVFFFFFFSFTFWSIEEKARSVKFQRKKILKNLDNFFCKIIWKIVFMIWQVCSWLQRLFKTKLFKRKSSNFVKNSSIFSFLTPQNALNISRHLTLVGHINLTYNHMYQI